MTQQELEQAWEQMRQERADDARRADQAAAWLKLQLGFGNVHGAGGGAWGQFSQVSPYPIQYTLKLVHETYGPYLEDYEKALATMPFVTKTMRRFGEEIEVTTPFGVYPVKFEYFDNHCTGY